MFKKLKDKIAEEVKQSPSKISATVSQIAQAVVSPSSSSVVEPSSTTDNHFSISDDLDETPRTSVSKWGFTSVDLREATPPQPPGIGSQSRRASVSSVLSDASSLFPVYESSGNTYHLQSDLESASELDESFSSHLPSTSKEQLVNILRKTQQRYNKYKGRYSDLARHYRELERENVKAKTILTESQDKALRRIEELKEQCLLEQRAKAHLEEILRNDLEEKDHLIMTLNTKIDLLKLEEGTDSSFNTYNNASNFTEVPATSQIVAEMQSSIKDSSDNTATLIDVTSNTVISEISLSTSATESKDLLREKVRKLEMLLAKCKDAIKIHKEKVKEFSAENQYLQTELTESKESSNKQVQQLTAELSAAREQIGKLQTCEEESALSLAETKRTIHSEMEVKEEQITHLRDTIHGINEQKQELAEKCKQLQSQVTEMKRSQELGISSDSEKQIQELSRVKQEAVKLLHAETQKNMSELKDSMAGRIQELESQVQALTESNEEMTAQAFDAGNEVRQLENRNVALLDESGKLNDQVIALQGQTKQLESDNSALQDECRQFEKKFADTALANSELRTKLDEVLLLNSTLSAKIEDKHQVEVSSLEEKDSLINLKDKAISDLEVKQLHLEIAYSELQNSVALLECQLSDLNESNLKQLADLDYYVKVNKQLETDNMQLLECNTLLESDTLNVNTNLKKAEELIIELKALQEKESEKYVLSVKTNEDMIEQSKITFQEQSDTISRLLDEKEKLTEMLQKKETHIDVLNEELKTLNVDLMRLNNSVTGDISLFQTQLENERKKACDLVNTFESEKSRASEEISKLQGQIEMEKTGASTAINKLNEQIKKDRAKTNTIINKLKEKQEESSTTISNLQQQVVLEKDLAMETIGKLNELIEDARAKESAEMSKREQYENERNTEINMLKEKLKLASTTISNLQLQIKTDSLVAMDTVGKLNELVDNERTKANSAIKKQEQLEHEITTVKNTLEREQELASATISNLQDQMQLEKVEVISTINDLKEQIECDKTQADAAIAKQEQLKCEMSKACAIINKLEEQQKLSSTAMRNLEEKAELEKCHTMITINKLNEVIEKERMKANVTITKLQEINSDSEKKLSESSKLAIEKALKCEELVKSIQSHESEAKELHKTNTTVLILAEEENKVLTNKLSLLQVKEEELSAELEKKTDSCLLLQKKLAEMDELPKKIELMREELNQVNAKNTMLLEQIQSDAENQPDWPKMVEEAKSELQTVILEKCKLEENLQAKLDLEIVMGNTIQHLINEKDQLGSQIVDVQVMQQRIDQLLDDIHSLEQKLKDSLQTVANRESEINDIQESHRHKIKQLARDFDDKLHDREEEMLKIHDDEKANQEQTDGILAKQLRNQIKALKADARQSQAIIDDLKEKHNVLIKGNAVELSSLEEQLKQVNLTHEMELQESEKKWRQWLDREIETRDASHKEEVAALSKEWHWERKKALNTESAQPQELENTSQVAVAAVESGTGSLELMHRQLMSVTQELKEAKRKHKSETVELRRIMGSRLNVSEATELEYLRNILFEYMMGHETTVLARVIATVLKFDQDQTKKVIEKEEHKQSLLGQLGIL